MRLADIGDVIGSNRLQLTEREIDGQARYPGFPIRRHLEKHELRPAPRRDGTEPMNGTKISHFGASGRDVPREGYLRQ
ncbi:hypothetical protein Acid7E03_38910 [Acidisoma sp. 7E03]